MCDSIYTMFFGCNLPSAWEIASIIGGDITIIKKMRKGYSFSMGSHVGTGHTIETLEVEEYSTEHIKKALSDAGIDNPRYVLKGDCPLWVDRWVPASTLME